VRHRRPTRLRRVRSLRARVLTAALALVVVALGVVNVVALVTVRGNLLREVDRQLHSVPGGAGPPGRQFGTAVPGQTPGNAQPLQDNQLLSSLVISRLDARTGAVLDQVKGPLQSTAPLPDLSTVQERIRAGTIRDEVLSVGAVDDSGYHYRIRVLPTAPTGTVLVIAASLASMEGTVLMMAAVDGGVSLAVVLALLVVGFAVMRVGLRPLTDVETAAQRIAAGDLSVRAQHADEPTEVGSLARSFNGMIEQIEEAFDARRLSENRLRRFVADASHELRTPLTSIRAYAELFRCGALDVSPEGAQALHRIEAEATRMGRLVEDLLLLARLDEQRPLDVEPVNLDQLARDAVQDTAATNPSHVVRMFPPTPPINPPMVFGDEAGLRQVLANLLRNAVVHTPAGTTIQVSVTPAETEVILVVADNGPGMPADVAKNIFERFYRPDGSRTRTGTGLGLAIVHSMVAAHHGLVTLHTDPGQGAQFNVILPAALSPAEPDTGSGAHLTLHRVPEEGATGATEL
jgi:two-component system, OmpR family, sensor kinase